MAPLEFGDREKTIDNELEICEYFRWALKDIRGLTVFERNSVVRYINKKNRERKKASRKMMRKK